MRSHRHTLEVDIYTAFLYRLALVFLFFSLCRILFFLFNADLFGDIPLSRFLTLMRGGLVFDAAAIFIVNIPFSAMHLLPLPIRHRPGYQKALKTVYLVGNGAAITANMFDFFYYEYTLKRTTSLIFSQLANEQNLAQMGLRIVIEFWYGFLLLGFLLVLLSFLYNRVRVRPYEAKRRWAYIATHLVLLLASVVLMVGGIRGDLRYSTRPITLSNAGKYVQHPSEMAIVLNTPFCLYRTLDKPGLKEVIYYSQEEADAIFFPVVEPGHSERIAENVVILILESFSTEHIGFLNRERDNGGSRGFTPFMDSLLQRSLAFQYAFANGRKSIEALSSIVTSLPSFEVPFVLSHYATNRLEGMARILDAYGYRTAFFHGAPNGSMGFDAFMNLAGVREYHGMNEYGNNADYDGIWGIWDEEFLQFTANRLDDFAEPFLAVIFTLSSHHPFKVPKRYENRFPRGSHPIHQTIGYTDMAVRRFFETAEQMPWYENTLFVITADHASVAVREDYMNLPGLFYVPIVFFHPAKAWARLDTETIAQHLDIMPTILNYLGVREPYLSFGKDLLNRESPNFVVNFSYGRYHVFMGDYVSPFNGEQVTGLYQFKTDPLLREDLSSRFPDTLGEMDDFIKAYVQQYNTRMLKDQLTAR